MAAGPLLGSGPGWNPHKSKGIIFDHLVVVVNYTRAVVIVIGVSTFSTSKFLSVCVFIGPPGSWRVQEFVQERWPVVDQGAEPRDV